MTALFLAMVTEVLIGGGTAAFENRLKHHPVWPSTKLGLFFGLLAAVITGVVGVVYFLISGSPGGVQ